MHRVHHLVEPGFKIFFSFRVEAHALDRECGLCGACPAQQALNVFARAFVISAQIFRARHRRKKFPLGRMLRRNDARAGSSEQAGVPGEEMLEAGVEQKMSQIRGGDTVVVLKAVT